MPERWFTIQGEARGDRTLGEQLQGLEPLFAEVPGKSVVDLGCAEGLIAIECAKRGAKWVHGVEIVPAHVAIARRLAGPLNCTFAEGDVEAYAEAWLKSGTKARVDIVLALAILHKLRSQAGVLKYATAVADLVVVRYPVGCSGVIIDSRSDYKSFNVPKFMLDRGFKIERKEMGPRSEAMHYFRRA